MLSVGIDSRHDACQSHDVNLDFTNQCEFLMPINNWVPTEEAARRLGVKRETIYAYVSRGRLTSRSAADGRRSEILLTDLRRMEAAQRRRRGPASEMRTELSEFVNGSIRYRGWALADLVASRTFESVAHLLWSGAFDDKGIDGWRPIGELQTLGVALSKHLPPRTLPLERIQIIVPATAAIDGFRHELTPDVVRVTGRSLISTMVAALPLIQDDGVQGYCPDGTRTNRTESIAEKLWRRLSRQPATDRTLELLDAALIIMADHGLAKSTVAARVAASAHCDPYGVVGAGLATASGALHGGASLAVEDILLDLQERESPTRLMSQQLRRGEHLIGFGHQRYPSGDPRAQLLLNLMEQRFKGQPKFETIHRIIEELTSRGYPPPNVDFALAALSSVAMMERGSAEAIFVIGRTAGWLAHALEEFQMAMTRS